MTHQHISFVKSAVRLIGYGILPFSILIAVAFLIVSELIGIAEEME